MQDFFYRYDYQYRFGPPPNPETTKAVNKIVDTIKEAFKDTEMFITESPLNNYDTPKGYFGVRSHKRRLLMLLEPNGNYPSPEKQREMIEKGYFLEKPL